MSWWLDRRFIWSSRAYGAKGGKEGCRGMIRSVLPQQLMVIVCERGTATQISISCLTPWLTEKNLNPKHPPTDSQPDPPLLYPHQHSIPQLRSYLDLIPKLNSSSYQFTQSLSHSVLVWILFEPKISQYNGPKLIEDFALPVSLCLHQLAMEQMVQMDSPM